MAAFNKFQQFVQDLATKVHNLETDTLRLALTATAPAATNSTLSDITQVGYGSFSSRDLANNTAVQTGGVLKLDADNLVITATHAAPNFRYVVLFNATATGSALIGWYDYGAGGVTLASGETFTASFSASGILTVE